MMFDLRFTIWQFLRAVADRVCPEAARIREQLDRARLR